MTLRVTHCLALCALGVLGTAWPQAPEPAPAARVLVLGTFHMGADADPLNPTVPDLLEPGRQEELNALVEKLAAFEPTKVALEAQPTSPTLAEFGRYLAGDLPAQEDERHQVGFRLAQRCDHDAVYGVDHPLFIDPQQILTWGSQHGQHAATARIFADYLRVASTWSGSFMRESSMVDIYRSFNSRETDRALHDVFVSMLSIGSDEDPIGATNLARWYERNIRIAHNVVQLAEPGDRIVVLFGANHRQLLLDFLGRVPGIEVVDAEEVLR